MATHKNKILVLTDLRKSALATLNNTLSIAKKINGTVELFHVKNPLEIVQTENQLLAMRSLNRFHTNTQKSFEKLLSSLNYDGIDIGYSFDFGRLKQEIAKKIEQYKPDLIVVGKRSRNPFKLTGDKLTNYIIKSTKCPIFIASTNASINKETPLIPAFYNNSSKVYSNFMDMASLPKDLGSVRKFKILSKEDIASKFEEEPALKRNEYVFEKNDNAVSTLSNYLSKSNTNLFCVEWENQLSNELKTLINKVEVPLLLASKHDTI